MLREPGRPALDWYVTWSPWLAAFFAPFCVAFVIGRMPTEGHVFLTSSIGPSTADDQYRAAARREGAQRLR